MLCTRTQHNLDRVLELGWTRRYLADRTLPSGHDATVPRIQTPRVLNRVPEFGWTRRYPEDTTLTSWNDAT